MQEYHDRFEYFETKRNKKIWNVDDKFCHPSFEKKNEKVSDHIVP